MRKTNPFLKRPGSFWKSLGPGLITGASDDDPSAITTFSQAGAKYGLLTLWTAIFAFPVLAVLQEICARIGIVTGKGLPGVLRSHYPRWLLYSLILLSCPAFLLNIGADIAVMGEAGNLLFPRIPAFYWSLAFTLLLFTAMLTLPYKKLAGIMKFFCLVLFVYMIVPFLSSQNPHLILKRSFIPSFRFDRNFFILLTGITGAIISPYLFFWQTSSAVEHMAITDPERKKSKKKIFISMRLDILTGAFFAVLIMYFIILTTGAILYDHGIKNIETLKDAALALRPLAGNLSYTLFAAGIIGTGFLIIPVLSSSVSYIISEAFNQKSGLSLLPEEAKLFYLVIAMAMGFGISMTAIGISSVKALFFTTVIYGITTPFLIGMILHISNNKKVLGLYCNKRLSNLVGGFALALMMATLFFLVYFLATGQ